MASTVINQIRDRYNVMTDAMLRIGDDFTWNIVSIYQQWKYRASAKMVSIMTAEPEAGNAASVLAHHARRGFDPLGIAPIGLGRNATQDEIERADRLITLAFSGDNKEMRKRISQYNHRHKLNYPMLEAMMLNSVGVDPAAAAAIISLTTDVPAIGREKHIVRIKREIISEGDNIFRAKRPCTYIDLSPSVRWDNGNLLVWGLPETIMQSCDRYIGKAMSDLIVLEGIPLENYTITSVSQKQATYMSFKIKGDDIYLDANGLDNIKQMPSP